LGKPAWPNDPSVSIEIEQLVVQFARENPGWRYDRIVGALANLGYHLSDQTVGNILNRHGLGTALERNRNTSWPQFIRHHKELFWATDVFTAEVWTGTGLTTFNVLVCIHLQTRRVLLAGITSFPNVPSRSTSPHHQHERNHQGLDNVIPCPLAIFTRPQISAHGIRAAASLRLG
jgi:hypothetical protein